MIGKCGELSPGRFVQGMKIEGVVKFYYQEALRRPNLKSLLLWRR